MKKALITLIIVMLMAGCSQMAVWSLAGSDLENEQTPAAGRVELIDGQMGVGVEVSYLEGARNDTMVGVFAIERLNTDPNGITPYLGAQATLCDNDVSGGYYGPIGGTLIPLTPNIDSVLEYRYIQPTGNVIVPEFEQEHVFYAGLRIRTR